MICQQCGCEFVSTDTHKERVRKFCSHTCTAQARWDAVRPQALYERLRTHIRVPLCRANGEIRAYTLLSVEDAGLALRVWTYGNTGYAWRKADRDDPPGASHVYLHRAVMGCRPRDGVYVDHINRDKLDNRRANLRIVTPAESRQNTPAIGGTSRFRGVQRHHTGRWIAQAQLDRQRYHLGLFDSEEEAAAVASEWRLANMPFTVEDSR